jgi:[ribulose-bisphosphate carboxylase]-lysine N-methyltransferase
LAIALFLLHERAKGGASRWAAYLTSLPADTGSPLQWGQEDLAELQGSQLLGTVEAYRAYFKQRYQQLQEELLGPSKPAFDPAGSDGCRNADTSWSVPCVLLSIPFLCQ